MVITECRPKPVATCNNNGTCDTNESCNCADCNDKADHCAINGTGEQLICTKDTTPPCFTDKFPYCFPACLDGYTRNASGQCVATTTNGEQWIAYATPYYIYMSKLPITPNTVAGRTFYIYNPEKVIAIATLSKTAFLANPTQAIQNAPTMPV